MHEAVKEMLGRYDCRSAADYTHALRQIMQELALLGLWRSKFFAKAAFYGGTALRLLHGLDRYSEDMDFSFLVPDPEFELGFYGDALARELQAFGFDVEFEPKQKARPNAVQSAFLKANTYRELLVLTTNEEIAREIPKGRVLKIRLEIDTNPPGGFSTETKYLLQPIPFAVRVYTLPCLFAGKMHAVICRQWRNRVKGRDWYDLVWYVSRSVPLDLGHLRQRMVQSGHLDAGYELNPDRFAELLAARIETLDVDRARTDVEPFVRDTRAMDVWSADFFRDVGSRIEFV